MQHILELCKEYISGDLDRVEFNNSLRDSLGDISDEEHREFITLIMCEIDSWKPVSGKDYSL